MLGEEICEDTPGRAPLADISDSGKDVLEGSLSIRKKPRSTGSGSSCKLRSTVVGGM